MKRILSTLILSLSVAILNTGAVSAMGFDEAISQSKPMAALIYADWIDNAATTVASYDDMGKQYASKFNFVKVNICTDEAKGFNQKYHIYPKLPYVLLFKDNGKISRYLNNDCFMNSSCFKERLDFFVN